MHKLNRYAALLLILLLSLSCCACQKEEKPAPSSVPAASGSTGWHEAQRISLNRCSIGVNRADDFSKINVEGMIIASFVHPTDPITLTVSEHVLDTEMTALYAATVAEGGNLLELIYGVNENYMVPGSMRKATLSTAGGTVYLMAAEDNPAYGGSAISGMSVFFTDGILVRIGYQNNSLTPDGIIAEMTGMMQSLTIDN